MLDLLVKAPFDIMLLDSTAEVKSIMSGTTGRREALAEIVTLVSSGSFSSEVLEKVLKAACVAVGAKCMSLAAMSSKSGGVRTWTAHTTGASELTARCTEAAANTCAHPDQVTNSDGLLISSILYGNGQSAGFASASLEDPDTLPLISSYLSLILTNISLSAELTEAGEQTRKRIAGVTAVHEIGQAINELDINKLLFMITEKAASVMDAQACSLLLRDFESDYLTIVASWGLANDIVQGTRVSLGQGVAGKVAQTGEAMLITDLGTDPRFAGSPVRPRKGIAASICAPLKDKMGRVNGVLNIRRHNPAPPFTEDDLKLFCIFASQAALALSNAKLYASLNQRIAELSTVSDLLHAINSTLNLDDVLKQIADNIVGVVGFDRCCVFLSDPRTGDLMADACRGYGFQELPERIALGEGVIGLAAQEQIPIFARDTMAFESGSEQSNQQTFLAAPIVVRDECIGVVVVDKSVSGKPILPAEVDLLSTFVSQAGIAIENARLYEAMEEKYAELNVLFEHSKTISSAYGLENIAHIATAIARKAVMCDGCMLLVLGDKRATIALQAAAGVPNDVAIELRGILSDESAVEFVRELRSATVLTNLDASAESDIGESVLKCLDSDEGSVLLVPLLAEDTTVGAFILLRYARPEFSTAELQLLSIVASQTAVVLKNALRYEQRMQRQVLDLSALYEFSRRISSSGSLEEALDAILAIVGDIVDCDESVIYAINQDTRLMIPTAERFVGNISRTLFEQPLDGKSVMSWTVQEGKAVVSPDISCDPRFEPIDTGERTLRSMMSIPLMVQDEAVGVLCVSSFSPNLYSEDDARVLSIIASQSAAIYKELEALAALTTYTDNILSSIAAGVVTVSNDGAILTWNRAADSIVGMSVSEVVGTHYREVIGALPIAEADKVSTIQIIEKVRETGETYQGYKLCYHPLNDEVMYLNVSASILSNNSGEPLGLVIIFEDITKEINMEDEFRRMGELAAIGQLAASIAHELRNPLSSIKGAAQFLQKEYESEAAINEFLGIIIEEVNGLSMLTTEFLEFARPMELELTPVNLNDVIRNILQLMSIYISESGSVVIDHLDSKLPLIQADKKQIEQVLKNCILNSLQAMPEGGTISIMTESAGSRAVSLSVTDTGMGIAENKLSRIFIPFFTTKTKGTGLGLSVVQKIVENHGGHIEVASVVGQGTTFKTILPIAGVVRTTPPEADTTERRVGKISVDRVRHPLE